MREAGTEMDMLSRIALDALVFGQVINLEAWIGVGFFVALFSTLVFVPLVIEITQAPKLLKDRHYGLFALVTFIWCFSVFTIGWIVLPMIVAIWHPYPTTPPSP
jgi:hypothetical protein